MKDDPNGELLALAVEDMIEDARYAANLGGAEGARRMVAAYEGCRGSDLVGLAARCVDGATVVDRIAAARCVEVWNGVLHLQGKSRGAGVSATSLHKAAELLGYVAPCVRVWADPV